MPAKRKQDLRVVTVEYNLISRHHGCMTMPRTFSREQPAVKPIVVPPQRRTGLRCLAASVVSGGLLWLCYSPVGCGWLAWVALVPWLMLVRAELPIRKRYPIAWLGGLAFYIPALAWMRNGDPAMFYLWFLLALYCAWYFAAALWLIRRLDRRTRLPLTVTVPLVWTAMEFARGELMGGYAWYQLGHSQHVFPPAIQIADITGVAGISFVVAMVNGLIAEFISQKQPAAGSKQPAAKPLFLLPAAGCLLLTLAYGGWRLGQSDFAAGPQVALLQTSVGQTERNKADAKAAGDPLAVQSIEQQDVTLAKEAIKHSPPPDLVILPETAFPYDWYEVSPDAPDDTNHAEWKSLQLRFNASARQYVSLVGVPTLLGLNAQVLDAQGKGHRYNSAILLTPNGVNLGRYDKIHLLPFGEYLPFKDTIPFLKKFSPYGDFDYSITPGEGQTRLPFTVRGRTYQLGVLICYEAVDAALTRGLVRPGAAPPADIVVNMTNDGWYMGSSEHAEHLAVSRFAAVEARRPVLRAVNGGISAVIDGNGRIVALPKPTWAESHSVTGVINAAVPLDDRTSLYARLGDWLPWGCWGLLLIGCLWRSKGA
jgi:apolipoprotein N-acyltransferase